MPFVYSNDGDSMRSVDPGYVPADGEAVFANYATEPELRAAFAGRINIARLAKVAELRSACAAEIAGGYQSSALGSAHTYPSSSTDQSNMLGSVTDSLMPELAADWTTPFWCADGSGAWSFAPHTAVQIRQAGRDGKAMIVAAQMKLGALTAQVQAATTFDAVEALAWS